MSDAPAAAGDDPLPPPAARRLPPFAVTERLVRRLAPRGHNLVFELLLASSRRRRWGLNDTTLAICCLLSFVTVFRFALFPFTLTILVLLYMGIMMPACRFPRLMRVNAWAEDLLITPLPSAAYATAFARFFWVAGVFVFLPYFVFLYLGYFCGLQWEGLADWYHGDMMLLGFVGQASVLGVCAAAYWAFLAGRPFSWVAVVVVVGLLMLGVVVPGVFAVTRIRWWNWWAVGTLARMFDVYMNAIRDLLGLQYAASQFRYHSSRALIDVDRWLLVCIGMMPPMAVVGLFAFWRVRTAYVARWCRRLFP